MRAKPGVRYWWQTELVHRERALTAALKAVRPQDEAWQRFAQKLAHAFVQWQVTDFITPSGTPTTKGNATKVVERAVWEALQAVARDWVDYPLGAGTGAVVLWCQENDPGINGTLRGQGSDQARG